ncbi:TetR/AcrR family transcriptional regulator [Amycolatopsis sp. FDAARGOS 1241]|uniref:TetR/AcrR family transcriptional regulator n=1 Tax=Amycolatopsis sp. FDAARGOS 1241 TaxID=2778070 RepID=UPI001950B868|nr:TetR/AcrR family transcriptional regulator [Amycolatopsis sp. FDAARGOS 1241]QRP42844.1 TetR family transcriptional regulator [Amycolatopsis sp. FDAARGOS 1241]
MASSGIDARRKAAFEEGNESYVSRREEIIRSAAHVFRERGYESATLRDVAAALGTDRASLYYYVGSKEELLQEIVRAAIGRDIAAAEAVVRSRVTTPEKVRGLIRAMVTSYADNYPHMNVYMEDLGRIARQDSEWSVGIIEHLRTYESLVHTILAQGHRDGTLRNDLSVELCALALFGMVNWMHRWYRPASKWNTEEIAETFTEIYLGGYGVHAVPGQGNHRTVSP